MNQKSNIAISVKHIKKDFKLPHEKSNSLKSSILSLFNRRKGYEVQHALKDVSFEVKKGEFFGIVGRNGSGKSTLLKILAQIYQPTDGKVEHKGKLVPFIELGVGFNPELSGRENVYLNGALLGFTRREIDARYDDIVAFAELEKFMDQKLKNYSSGMQVRLAFSVATRAEAEILLVDEVLAVGDADFQRKCYDYFKSLKKTGKTVVFVTHSMSAVKEYCDRAILIKEGLIAFEGKADAVSDEYLKMFNRNDGSTETAFNDRWGNMDIVVDDIKIKADADDISIDSTVKSNISGAIEDVKVTYKFYDSSGKLVAGFSTQDIKRYNKLSITKDKKEQLHFSCRNILNNGKYDISVSVTSIDEVTIYDSWKAAASIVNTRDSDQEYPIVLDIR